MTMVATDGGRSHATDTRNGRDAEMRSVWDMSDGRFWEPIGDNCIDLFLMFDTNAHVSNGVPDVPVADVLEHARECAECTAAYVTVTGAGTPTYPAVLHYDW